MPITNILPGHNLLTRMQWAKRISDGWEETAKQAIDAWRTAGDDLIAAKAQLEHGEFLGMIETDLPFGKRTAQMLMKIARDPRLKNQPVGSLLPPSWRTLYELTRLEDTEFEQLIADGVMRPDMSRQEINKVRRIATVTADEARVLNLA